MAIPKRGKLWVCRDKWREEWCEAYYAEPSRYMPEYDYWDVSSMADYAGEMRVADAERIYGVQVPPHPYLVEIERVGGRIREVCVWEPCDE